MARSTTSTASPFLLFLLSPSLLSVALSAEHRITDAQGLIELSNNVSNGTDYSGTTVVLDSDIDFSGGYSERFAPIGRDSFNYFLGAFDGQGHTISNLKVNSSSENIGLFGNSPGITIQNVVIDGSCSFASSYSSGDSSVGSIIGYCYSFDGPCTIEGVVNMGSVLLEGNTTGNALIGGIVGYTILSFNNPITLKNCVNYGSVTHSGVCSGNYAHMGGIVGMSQGKSISYISIQNCLNYGTIIHSGTSKNLAIGGIAGLGYYATFENCVSSGAISTNQESECIGGILGGITTDTNITHCFWTRDAGNVNVYGFNEDKVDVINTSIATLDQATLDELNRYITEEKKDSTWSRWVMLHLNGGRINNISQQSLVEIQKHFPEPVREGNTFLFWCKDAVCGEVFDPETGDVSTLYAGWTPNNYTVTFDVNGGDELPTPTRTVTFNTPYGELPTPKRTGFTFLGWFNDKNESVTGSTIVSTPNDHTLHAHWKETKPGYVEIVFGKKDMSEEEIKVIIKQYADTEEFTIIKIEDDGSGETKVIIKFTDINDATTFVEVAKTSSGEIDIIKNIVLIDGINSFSLTLHPVMLLGLLF